MGVSKELVVQRTSLGWHWDKKFNQSHKPDSSSREKISELRMTNILNHLKENCRRKSC
jgi:hypothetical protein